MFDAWKKSKRSYAQCGEDLIVDFVLENRFGISRPTYLDIGAHAPVYLSNTYLFYRKGGSGVLVEPDPLLWKQIKKSRARDICLNVGVGISSATAADFHIMDCRTLNTFSRQDAERYQSQDGHRIEQIMSVPLVPVVKIIEENFPATPNFISLDVEGLDLDILKSLDFERFRPEVMCVETLTYTRDFSGVKLCDIVELMEGNGYFVYADTFINSIFVDRRAWDRRP